MGYRVVAPYVTLKVKDQTGADVVVGYYAGATVPAEVNENSLKHHLDAGMVVEDGFPEADVLAAPAGTPMPGEPPNVPVTEQPVSALPMDERLRRAQEAVTNTQPERGNGRPAGNASREVWAAHAAAAGAPEEETRPVEEGGLSRDDLRARYGG